ncbi:MAG: hypothetical protein ABR976_18945 [Terracidiphilus sp.]|jgi:hypothetical protein
MKRLSASLLLLLSVASVYAQGASTNESSNGFFSSWAARTSATQAKQPPWAVPLVTTYTGLIQVARTDILRQIAPARTDTWNFDNSKGVNLVPWANTELVVNLPPYIEHNTTAKDGWGDFSFLVKYRIASGNQQHGSYTFSAWALTTVPSGSFKNGSTNGSVQPNVGGGKGFGNFDVQTTLGATLPTGTPATTTSGRPILWNTVAQYRIAKLFWPELESNATFFKGGPNDGKTQEFITPGMIIGKCAFRPSDPKSRPGLAFGAGMQIATSKLHTYNHELVVTARLIF